MYDDVNLACRGDQFTIYTDVKPLYYTPETNTILCKLYITRKRKRNQ